MLLKAAPSPRRPWRFSGWRRRSASGADEDEARVRWHEPRCVVVARLLGWARGDSPAHMVRRSAAISSGHIGSSSRIPICSGSVEGSLDEPLPCLLLYAGEHGGTCRAFSRDGRLWHAVGLRRLCRRWYSSRRDGRRCQCHPCHPQ